MVAGERDLFTFDAYIPQASCKVPPVLAVITLQIRHIVGAYAIMPHSKHGNCICEHVEQDDFSSLRLATS